MKIVNGLMTPMEAANRLGLKSKQCIYRAARNGRCVGGKVIKLPTVLVLGKIRIHVADLDAFIAECNAAAGNTSSRVLGVMDRTEIAVNEPAYPESMRGKKRGTHRSETCATVGGGGGGGAGREAFGGRLGRRE